jgi:hypothetical protein
VDQVTAPHVLSADEAERIIRDLEKEGIYRPGTTRGAEVEPSRIDSSLSIAPTGAEGFFERYPGCTQDHLDVYRALYRRAKQDGTRCFPKLATLAEDLVRAGCRRIPERTLDRRLGDLKAWGWVRANRQRRVGPNGGELLAHNAYTLLVPLADLPMVAPRSERGKREGWTRPGRAMVAPRSEQGIHPSPEENESYGGATVPPATMGETAGRAVAPVRPSQNRRSHRGASPMVAPQEPPTVKKPSALNGKGVTTCTERSPRAHARTHEDGQELDDATPFDDLDPDSDLAAFVEVVEALKAAGLVASSVEVYENDDPRLRPRRTVGGYCATVEEWQAQWSASSPVRGGSA